MAHTVIDDKFYVDTAFLNSLSGIPGVSLNHMGFGEFYATTPHGTVDFDRMRGKDFPGQSGRSHRAYDREGYGMKATGWLIDQVESRGKSVRVASAGRVAKLMSRQEKILQGYMADAVRSGVRPATGWDELPDGVRRALRQVKDQETLWMDVDRWFDDNAPGHRPRWASDDASLRSRIIRLAASRPELRSDLLPLVKEAASDTPTPVPQVGDILYSSWGYDQTNIDFYEVRKVTGSMVVLQKLQKRVVRDLGAEVYVVPVPGQYGQSVPLRRKFGPSWRGGAYSVSINAHASAFKWDGVPLAQTGVGYGH